jgi:hypothetical protein
MNDTSTRALLAEALADFRNRFGEGAFTSRRRLLSLLADRMPGSQREIKILALALEDGAVETLKNAGPRLSLEIDRLCAAMESRHGTRPDIARSVLTALAEGLGLNTAAISATTSDPAGAGSDWLGASSVVAMAPESKPVPPAGGGTTAERPAAPPPPSPSPRRPTGRTRLLAVAVILVAAGGYVAADRMGWFAPPPAEAPKTRPDPAPRVEPSPPPAKEPVSPKRDEPPPAPRPQPAPTPAPTGTPEPPPVLPATPPGADPTIDADDGEGTEPPTASPAPGPSPIPGPAPTPPAPLQAGGLPPMLVPPNGAMPLPTLTTNETATDRGWFFSVPSGGPVPYIGLVMVSKQGGWAHGQFRAFAPQNGQPLPVFMSIDTPFETVPFPQGAMRRMWVRRWTVNNVGIADVCIGVARQNAREVPTRGFRLCLFLDGCQRMIGCGEVP